MNIRTRLTLIFFGIVIIVVSIVSLSIYYFSSEYREQDFYRRLKNRAINTAKLLTGYEEVDVALLQRMERENPANLPEQQVSIFNYKNELLYKGVGESRIPIDTALLSRIRRSGEIRFRHGSHEALGFLYADNDDRFTVVAAARDINGLDALKNLRTVLVMTFTASVFIVSVLGWIFSGRVLKPIAKIVEEVDSITEANLDQRLDEGNRKDELGKLAFTFNKMLSRLQRAFFSQKNFIANASHEIKTPITVMAGQIEVTLLQERSPAYYANVLRSVLGGIKGMNRLSTQLLLLAQTSSGNAERRFNPIHIDDILWSVKDELLKAYPDYTVDIQFAAGIEDKSLMVQGDEGLLKVVIFNLMENGCKYSNDGRVALIMGSTGDAIRIEFINNSDGITAEELEKIFEPFYRAGSAKKVKGFGIGLPLTKKILELHDGTISVVSVPGATTTFTISIPAGV